MRHELEKEAKAAHLRECLRPSEPSVPDVVFASGEVARPVPRLPEAIAVHLPAALAERSVPVWRSLQVEVTQLLQVCAHNLIERKEFKR